jgi:hypothetical protein
MSPPARPVKSALSKDTQSKLNRNEKFIENLMADGKSQGRAFLQDPESMRYDDQIR